MSGRAAFGLNTELQYVPGVGPERARKLLKLDLKTARDVLFFFPKDHERPATTCRIDELREGEAASIVGVVSEAELINTRTPGRSIFGILIENESGVLRCVFFNQPFRADTLHVGMRVLVSGTPKVSGLRLELVHPKVTILADDEAIPQAPILPVYPLTEGLKQTDLRKLTRTCLETLPEGLNEAMPETIRRAAAQRLREAAIDIPDTLPDIASTIRSLHYPASDADLVAAKSRLIFQELIVMQLALAMRRRQLTSDLLAPPLVTSPVIDARIVNRFPFEITKDQRQVMREIATDLARQFPMNRMLQGDVGSGKTVVAVYAMLVAVAAGYQAVLMAPTEILARQHFASIQRLLADTRVSLRLLCGSLSAGERRETLRSVAEGSANILIGTQSLVYGGIDFAKLGLYIIDEQHKFGVDQRVALRTKGTAAHCLVMSATPIPRSLALTLFGDTDLSVIREKPSGRGTVHTYLSHDGWKDRWWQFVEQRLAEGRQAIVVAPRIAPEVKTKTETDAESETSEIDETDSVEEVSSVQQVYESLSRDVFPNRRVGLLHGRMSADAKLETMQRFERGSIDVLVSTTVVEVGIDVPNATVMTILGAQRFGLAQLHQLRGRVSRSAHAGHVCLFTDGEMPPDEYERLKIFESTSDGFELAEADFRLRGPGEILGRRQSGLPPLRVADLQRDIRILEVAREIARDQLEQDPELSDPLWSELRNQVLRRYGAHLSLGDVA